ncbi:BTB/POZ domain-containing protein [Hibiscus syriacus]|uniref:BTB/POZ domain-containing protein n=1 Tax=Hibiscus syriacus TaxID=106335 RepID=A0A6A2ZM93_HIBSY|nr:BTB/POZ domain-containing protein [Hibiscus syriacus]
MEESRRRTQRRVAKFLTELNAYSFKNGELGPSDVRLTSKDEEEKVVSYLTQLDLHGSIPEVLQRVSSEPSTSARSDGILLNLLSDVLQAKDDKARREIKILISQLLGEDSLDDDNRFDVSKDTLYHLCQRCLSCLVLCLSEAIGVLMAEIAREADNLQWIVDILIEKRMTNEFVKLWADQRELVELHSKIPTMYWHDISRITAQLCIAIGRGNILVLIMLKVLVILKIQLA